MKQNQSTRFITANLYMCSELSTSAVNSRYTLIDNPRTAATASDIASQTVGCACTVDIKSSTVASSCRAATASEITSVANGPIMCTPRISPNFSSLTTLMNPS